MEQHMKNIVQEEKDQDTRENKIERHTIEILFYFGLDFVCICYLFILFYFLPSFDQTVRYWDVCTV